MVRPWCAARSSRTQNLICNQYIDFDDNFVFLSASRQVHIYSRPTRRHVLSFPPFSASIRSINSAFKVSEVNRSVPSSDRDASLDDLRYQRTPMGEAILDSFLFNGDLVGRHDMGFSA